MSWQPLVEDLIAERGVRLLAYAAMLTARDADPEDLFQDALVKCFSRRRAITTVGEADSYVRRAMQTIAIDRARARGVRQRASDRAFSREPASADLDVGMDLRRALRELSPRERVCIVMKYFDDMTIVQIAGDLGLADGTIKRYLADATKALSLHFGSAVEFGDGPERVDVVSGKGRNRS
jgi:RNA polymerase sigma-70 factor (ECF subfamily)